MKVELVALAVTVAIVLYHRTRARRTPLGLMSTDWLNEQERQAITKSREIDSVVWKWPVKKGRTV